MASQVTHLYYTEKIFEKFLKNRIKNEKEFFIGALFPDVRYMSKVDKSVTHFCDNIYFIRDNIYINENDSDFVCGLKVHSLIDYVHSESLENSNIYFLYKERFKNIRTPILMMEDIMHFDSILYMKKYLNFLNEILDEETKFNKNIKKEDIEKWHNITIDLLSKKITGETFLSFSLGMGCFKEKDIREDINAYENIKNEKILTNIFDDIEKEIDKLTIKDIIKQ